MAGQRQVRDALAVARGGLVDDYARVRSATESLCRPLATEDYGLQTMPEVSPAKWHIAHTSWFFETFLLLRFVTGYRAFDPSYDHLFNSYYVTHSVPFPRASRGLLSRPTVEEVYAYRAAVDAAMVALIETVDGERWQDIRSLIVLGLNHEQQHQELLLTDLKHAFGQNPLRPAYRDDLAPFPRTRNSRAGWSAFSAGLYEIGAEAQGFAFDNEQPRHRCWLEGFALADRPVSNSEYLQFIEDGGYREPRWWLSEGWARVQSECWAAPLYWETRDGEWWHMTLGGMRRVDPGAPVCHISHYEADAYASWAGKRLPTEAEWEVAAARLVDDGGDRAPNANLLESGYLQPVGARDTSGIGQLFGDVWEWTASPYVAYPGFRIADGPVGEYNGKFMSGQMVLRGGSCVTPRGHVRASYRNFFYPQDRWQFSGIRLAEDR